MAEEISLQSLIILVVFAILAAIGVRQALTISKGLKTNASELRKKVEELDSGYATLKGEVEKLANEVDSKVTSDQLNARLAEIKSLVTSKVAKKRAKAK